MIRIIQNEDFSVEEFENLITLLHKYEGIDYTRKSAAEHIQWARQAISIFEDSQAKEILLDIADYALARKM
jgi:octaprenyl-diphosphate synthase